MTIVPQSPPAVAHRLEPLTADEVARAVCILRSERQLGDAMRFVIVTLYEPAKETVLGFRSGDPVEREAFAVLLDKDTSKTYEAIVSLSTGRVTSWEHISANGYLVSRPSKLMDSRTLSRSRMRNVATCRPRASSSSVAPEASSTSRVRA